MLLTNGANGGGPFGEGAAEAAVAVDLYPFMPFVRPGGAVSRPARRRLGPPPPSGAPLHRAAVETKDMLASIRGLYGKPEFLRRKMTETAGTAADRIRR